MIDDVECFPAAVAAKRKKVSVGAIYHAVRTGVLVPRVAGGRYVFPAPALEAWTPGWVGAAERRFGKKGELDG